MVISPGQESNGRPSPGELTTSPLRGGPSESSQPTIEEHLSAEAIAALQEAAWRRTWDHVWAHSPFYRQHLRRAGLSPDEPVPLSQLHRIPPIDKTVVSEHSQAFLCVPRDQVVDIVTTSGTTGPSLLWMLTERDLQRLALNEWLSFRCAGLTARDTVLLAVTLDRGFIAGLAYFLGLRMLGCGIIRVGPSTPALHLDLMRRLRPTAIVGVPSFLCLLADKAAEAGLDPATLGVRQAVCIGEAIRHPDLTLNRAGMTLEQRWQTRVCSTYGVTELAASLCECEHGCGGHLHPELLHLEVLDPAGQPVAEGQVGEVTATTFGVEAMPLVRYRTGDCAAIHRQPCRCGRRTVRLGPIVGRQGHKLKLKGTTLFPSTLKAVLDATAGLAAYVILARRTADGADAVEVRIACATDPAPLTRTLRERFQGAARVAPDITVASAAEVEALQMPEGTRKRRHFIDLRE